MQKSSYYYRAYGFGLDGVSWASESASFQTLAAQLAGIQIEPISVVGSTQVTFAGELSDNGGEDPTVLVYFGVNDGGTSAAAWDSVVDLGVVTIGEFSGIISPLNTNTNYYYRAAAQNSGGTAWSDRTFSFTTPDLPQLRISEFMASNGSHHLTRLRATADDRFRGADQSYDWIEIENNTTEPADIGGYHLTDRQTSPKKWEFPPGTSIEAGQSIVVFASGVNMPNAELDEQGSIHADFKLSSTGEYLALNDPDGLPVSEFNSRYPQQVRDVSYGFFGTTPGYFVTPTPGEPNASSLFNIGPHVEEVADEISGAVAGQRLVVSAVVSQNSAPIESVQLTYRLMYEDEVVVAMLDDGQTDVSGDVTAGDGIFSAPIPGSSIQAGQMIRWAVTATDTSGLSSRQPIFAEETATSAPEYFGTVVEDPTVTSGLPIFQWFIEPGQERRADQTRGTRSSVFYAGEFYDNVFVRLRGGSSTNLVKKSYKFDFNSGDRFRFSPDAGRVSEINLNTTYTNKDYVRQPLAFETYDNAGLPASESFLMRVDRNGEFFAVSAFVEQPDADMLAREGLDPDGALYKMFNTFTSATSGVEKKTREYENNGDLAAFIDNMNSLSGVELRNYVFDNVDIPMTLNYLAATTIQQNSDQQAKNHYLYRDSNGSGEWFPIPWDLDLTFGLHFMSRDNIRTDIIWADKDAFTTFAGVTIWPSHPFVGDRNHQGNRSWNRLIDALYRVPEFRELYLRRLRTLMDELLQAPGTPRSELQFDKRLDEFLAQAGPDADRDHEQWAKWGDDLTMAQAIERLKTDYLAVRRVHLYQTHSVDNNDGEDIAGIPDSQPGDIVLRFKEVVFDPASGNPSEEYLALENAQSTAVDVSDWRLDGTDASATMKPGTVIPANGTLYLSPDVTSFRARSSGPSGGQGLLVQPFKGNLSNDGDTLQLIDRAQRVVDRFEYAGTGRSSQSVLRVTEINYNPVDADVSIGELNTNNDSFEFVELINSGDQVINLQGVSFVERDGQGIDFVFPAMELNAGERVVVVNNPVAFASRYGSTINIAGEFSDRLANGGERITLLDANGDVIQEFSYDDAAEWPTAADGNGPTLEVVDVAADYNDPANWRASAVSNGSPGAPSPDFSPGDLNQNGTAGLDDIDVLCAAIQAGDTQLDLNGDERMDTTDLQFLAENLLRTGLGDANLDGIFNSSDLVQSFTAGQYEDDVDDNSDWTTGDWNCDGEFDSSDLVSAFQAGAYSVIARPR